MAQKPTMEADPIGTLTGYLAPPMAGVIGSVAETVTGADHSISEIRKDAERALIAAEVVHYDAIDVSRIALAARLIKLAQQEGEI